MNKLSEYLVLARTRASDLENVRKLNCWGSSLHDVSILRRMPNIQVVSLSVNEITSLADFAFCLNLEELYIRKNNIEDLSEICHLCQLPKLRNLWLADNPCATGDLYRLTVLRTLPNLQKLDNVAVQPDEINEALERDLELYLIKRVIPSTSATPPPSSSPPPHNYACSPPGSPTCGVGTITVLRSPEVRTSMVEGGVECGREEGKEEEVGGPITLTWEETNKIRGQLGLRLLPVEKVTPLKPRSCHTAKQRNANILHAVLSLIKELDVDSLESVADAVRNKMESL